MVAAQEHILKYLDREFKQKLDILTEHLVCVYRSQTTQSLFLKTQTILMDLGGRNVASLKTSLRKRNIKTD